MLSIFGPRNAAETGRILTPEGTLLIAAPGPGHLRELQRPLGMISIDRRKPQRLAGTYRDYARSGVTSVNYQLSLDHADLTALVSMGPSARHITPQALAARIRSLPSPFTGGLPAGASRLAIPPARTPGPAPRRSVRPDAGPGW